MHQNQSSSSLEISRSSLSILIAIGLCLLGGSSASAQTKALSAKQEKIFAQRPDLLYFLGRSNNANLVLYNAASKDQSLVHPFVRSEWLMLAEKGQTEALNSLDKTVYDHRVTAGAAENEKTMYLTRVPDRKIAISYDKALGRPVARMKINGQPSRLLRVWVELGFLNLSVKYFELWGTDEKTNQAVSERISIK